MLVIGGGVTGAGVALDAASRGLKTALVEKGTSRRARRRSPPRWSTAASATSSSASSASSTRTWPSVSACSTTPPTWSRPLPFLIPLFGRDGVVSKAVARSYASALWMYDLTGGWRIGERHRRGRPRTRRWRTSRPSNTDHLVAGFLYFDARADDARLTLTLARTAALEYGAAVANYTPVVAPHDRRRRPRRGAVVRPEPDDDPAATSRSAPGSWSTPPACGPTRSAPSTKGRDPHASARPRASTSPCRPTAAVRHRRRHPGAQGQALDLRRPLARDRPRLPRHDRHRLHRPARRSGCTPEDVDYLLDAANNVTTSHLTRADVDRRLGRPAPAPGAASEGRARLGAHRRPLPPPHRHARRRTAS